MGVGWNRLLGGKLLPPDSGGLKEAGQRIGLALDISPPPTTEELALAMEGHVVIRIILD